MKSEQVKVGVRVYTHDFGKGTILLVDSDNTFLVGFDVADTRLHNASRVKDVSVGYENRCYWFWFGEPDISKVHIAVTCGKGGRECTIPRTSHTCSLKCEIGEKVVAPEEVKVEATKFKVGDIVKGNDPERYAYTNNNMIAGEVVSVDGTDLRVKILEMNTFFDREQIGRAYSVKDNYFDLVVNDFNEGDTVMFLGREMHEEYPEWFPEVGRRGVVIGKGVVGGNVEIEWERGVTSADDKWFAPYYLLEKVEAVEKKIGLAQFVLTQEDVNKIDTLVTNIFLKTTYSEIEKWAHEIRGIVYGQK